MSKKNRKRDFFKEDSPHGLVKRVMLKKYFQAYIAKTQNEKFTLNTVFIDAFAGEGRYGNDWPEEIEKYGSPLIAEMVALEFYYRRDAKEQKADKASIWGWQDLALDPETELAVELETKSARKKYFSGHAKITLIFIERDRKRYQKLAANVELLMIKFLKSHYPTYQYGFSQQEGKMKLYIDTGVFSLKIKVVHDRFVNISAPKMFQDQSVRSLTFLDPYGFKHTPMAHIQQFVPGTGNEILINFMSSFVNRFVSRCAEDVAKLYGIDKQDQEEEVGLAEFVQKIVRFCDPERRNEFSNNINICTSNYEAYLKRKTKCKYSLTFEIKDKGNTTFFHMVHITNHIRGVEAMKESMNRCSQKEGEMVMSDYDIVSKGQKLNFGNMDDRNKVAEMILRQFRGKKHITLDRIKYYILMETNYLFNKKPLKSLQKSEKMTVERVDGKDQNVKFTYPDVDKESKKPITWLFSFKDEDYGNETTNNLETDDEKSNVKVSNTKKKTEQVKGKRDKRPSDTCHKDKKNVLGGKAKENKKCTQMTESLAGNSLKSGRDEKSLDISINDVDTNKKAAESLPVGETTVVGSSETTYGATTNEHTGEREVAKDSKVSKEGGQRVITSYYKKEKENKIEKAPLKQEMKRGRKRKLSYQSSTNETARNEKTAGSHTLYKYFKIQGSDPQ